MTPLDQLADILHDFSEEPAFCIDGKYYSYNDLQNTIAKIQDRIGKYSIPGHCNIGILTYDDLETYASIIAVLFLGHAFVPINPWHPAVRNQSMIEQAGVKLILCSRKDEASEIFSTEKTTLVRTEGEIKAGHVIRVPLSAYQHAYILFTSGSTGLPKGVPVTVNNLNAFLEAFFANGYKIDHRDRFLQVFDLTFDLSIMSYLAPLCIGACVYTVPFDVVKYTYAYNLLEKYELTFALMAPSILTGLRTYFSEISLPKMKYSLFCGEALHEDLIKDWKECIPLAKIQNVYGPTEATIFCMYYEVSGDSKNKSINGILSIGTPLKGTKACIVDEQNQLVVRGEKGELCLSGEQVISGYLKNENTTGEKFINVSGDRYYKTGDICSCDVGGDYYFHGRIDFQVKINGFRVELGEIDYHARTYLKTHAVVTHALPDAAGNMHVYLFVENFNSNFEGLKKYLKTKLPGYMIPTKYYSTESFPLNSNGKIDRNKLIKMFS